MSYSPGGGGSSSISGSSDVALNSPANGQVLGYNSTLSKWQNQTISPSGSNLEIDNEGSSLTSAATSLNFVGSGVTATNSGSAVTVTVSGSSGSGVPGAVYFDTYFSGANDNAKIASMNSFHQGLAANATHPVVMFDSRQYNFSTAISLYSGMKLFGGGHSPSREFGTGTILNWQGGSGTSMFSFPGTQSGQGYPSDGSPRDVAISYIQMNGGSTADCLPKYDPTTSSSYSGHTLWNTTFHACGWVGWSTIWWGWGDGCTISGPTHIQACTNTPFNIGGAECSIFGNDAYSFADCSLSAWMTGGQPFFRSSLEKSSIGRMMFSARSNSYQLKIESGRNMIIDGTAFDAPDSVPTYGSGIQITGCTGITITNCSFKGMMTAPASASGGTTTNQGWITMTGGSQLTVQGCNFVLRGNNPPATSVPLLAVASSVAANSVKWGYNNYSNFSGDAIVNQAVTGQVTNIADPSLTITTG